MRRLLVTGGAGFIGVNFVRYWLQAHPGDRIMILDALTYAGHEASLEAIQTRSEFRFVRGNICDTALVESLLRAERLDTIVHFAAESHVDRSIAAPDAFMTTNIMGTYSLLKAARHVWQESKNATAAHRFHHVSTDEVYGALGATDPPFTESTTYAPNSPYAASKAAADHLVRAYHRTYGLNTTISNCSNNYGPYQYPEKLIPLTIINILIGKPLPLYGDGKQIRDWLHVNDHCRAIERILERGAVGEIYNVGGDQTECDNLTLVERICQIMDELFERQSELVSRFPNSPAARQLASSSLIRFVEDRPGHDRRYVIDAGKLREELNFAPTVELDDGLRSTCEWYCEHESWWRNVISRLQ